MKKTLGILVIFLALAFVVTGCSASSDEEAIKDVVNENVDYLNEEDVDGYLTTLDLSSAEMNQTKAALDQTFQIYDLKFVAESIDIEEVKDDTAKVIVVQTTEKISGDQPFQDNRLEVRHTLKKVDGEWKFTNTEMLNMEMLND